MRADPSRRWTIAELARIACLSRAPFARHFRQATKTSPQRWLAQYRLELAKRYLLETDSTLAFIATVVGYSSEFALAKAFKRLVGIAPGIYRRRSASASTVTTMTTTFRAAA